LGQKLAVALKQEFHSLGIAMGYSYAGSPVIVPDDSGAPPDEPSVYVQTARPGHRAPHAWITPGVSTVDLFGGGFVLLRLGEDAPDGRMLIRVAQDAGMPLECVTVTAPEASRVYERRLVLVRPDGMVAWRADAMPQNLKGLVDRVRGAAT
jgi:hypothetical protein